MRSYLPVLSLILLWTGAVQAQGVLVPSDNSLTPLARVGHQVTVTITDQVAETQVAQVFRNPTDRQLEATYIFPVPRGASVNQFSLWVDGKKMAGELVKSDKAREIYTDIVRRTQDPGLLEYVDNNLLRLRVFPVPARGEQKIALRFTSVATQDGNAIAYVYPLKTDTKSASVEENFSLTATIKSQHGIQNVYSPSHRLSIHRASDREVTVGCERSEAANDKDFQLYYSLSDKDVSLTTLAHRPVSSEDGHFMMLLSPRLELTKKHVVPRDVVLVLDTSGSMQGVKMEQARKALKHCLNHMNKQDRFALISFATAVDRYREQLVDVDAEQLDSAQKWVDRLEAAGSTAIHEALLAALAMRSNDRHRTFTVVFFTDGMPTVGETDADKIQKDVLAKNSANTRIFTFGVGDDVNATLLDQLADQTRAVSTFVRPSEDIEAKVSSLYAKISHPVLTNLKLTVGSNIHIKEVYPPQLPDLFHGGQLVVLGRYSGQGPAAVTLTGMVGKETREFVYETTFPRKTDDKKMFVEHLWARRKVGYLLDQIRTNGNQKELVEEVVSLAKKYGIATPYTSYLVAPDSRTPLADQAGHEPTADPLAFGATGGGESFAVETRDGGIPVTSAQLIRVSPWKITENESHRDSRNFGYADQPATAALESFAAGAPNVVGDGGLSGTGQAVQAPSAATVRVITSLHPENESQPVRRNFRSAPGGIPGGTGMGGPGGQPGAGYIDEMYTQTPAAPCAPAPSQNKQSLESCYQAMISGNQQACQTGQTGVELSLQTRALRDQSQMDQTAAKRIAERNLVMINGAWIDEGFAKEMPRLTIKAMSAAYFRMLEKHRELKEVFQLGNRVVWITPSGTALLIDPTQGKEKLTDEEIDRLFLVKK